MLLQKKREKKVSCTWSGGPTVVIRWRNWWSTYWCCQFSYESMIASDRTISSIGKIKWPFDHLRVCDNDWPLHVTPPQSTCTRTSPTTWRAPFFLSSFSSFPTSFKKIINLCGPIFRRIWMYDWKSKASFDKKSGEKINKWIKAVSKYCVRDMSRGMQLTLHLKTL